MLENLNWETIVDVLTKVKDLGEVQREQHYLQPPVRHTPATPKRVVYFDSESIVHPVNHEHEPYIICATFVNYEKGSARSMRYGSEKARAKDSSLQPLEAFWDACVKHTKKKDVTWIMAHNAGYDLLATGGAKRLFQRGYVPKNHPYEKGMTFIWDIAIPNKEQRFCLQPYASKKGGKIDSLCVEDRPCPKCRRKPKTIRDIRFVSTSNFYPLPLARLGKVFGLDKLAQQPEENIDFSRLDTYDIGPILDYCDRDVEIIRQAMEALFDACNRGKETGFGSFRSTLPSMSFNAYRTWFLDRDTLYCHDNKDAIRMERMAYYGGRVEVWKRGPAPEQIYGVDINSMYPFVMQEHLYPVKLRSYTKRENIDGMRLLLDKGYGLIAKVTVNTDQNAYPYRHEGRLIFPRGRFVTYLSTPEIRYALEHGHIEELRELGIYEMAPIFREFVRHFYAKREHHKEHGDDPNPVWDLLYKLMMNSLYGKFGQLKRDWVEVGTCDPELVETEEQLDVSGEKPQILRFRKFGGKVFMEEPIDSISYHAMPAVAAHVTAYARMLLWDYIQRAGEKNHYYNDTDSLYVNEAGFLRLKAAGVIHDTRLGALALEKKPEYIAFWGPKHYDVDGKRTLKGVSKDAVEKAPGVWNMLQWPSFKSAINTGNVEGFANVERTKHLSPTYSKGWVLRSGDVVPLEFDVKGEDVILKAWDQTSAYTTLDDLDEKANQDKPASYTVTVAREQLEQMFIETVGDLISELQAGEGPLLLANGEGGFWRMPSSNPPWFKNKGFTKKMVYHATETRRGAAWRLLTDEMERRFESGFYGETTQLIYHEIMKAMGQKPISERR